MSVNNPAFQTPDSMIGDSYGAAALLLVESLLHGLCENGHLSIEQCVAVADRTVEVQYEKALASPVEVQEIWRTHALLVSIAESLRVDVTH